MPVPIYDTPEGITAALDSLESFHELIKARREAGYQRGERLTQYYVLGRYELDTCGNFSVMLESTHSSIPEELFPDIPRVLDYRSFWAFAHERGKPDLRIMVTTKRLPPIWLTCLICERGWTIHDVHESEMECGTDTEELSAFVGKTLGEYKANLATRTDALYSLIGDGSIRHNGVWIGRNGSLSDDYVIAQGDVSGLFVWTAAHHVCQRNARADKYHHFFSLVIELAGFKALETTIRPTANRYGSEDYHGPWFEVKTEFGTIVIGWRKRVIAIDWSATGRDLLHLFDDITGTKGERDIHAWTYAEAIDYLGRIHQALANVPAHIA